MVNCRAFHHLVSGVLVTVLATGSAGLMAGTAQADTTGVTDPTVSTENPEPFVGDPLVFTVRPGSGDVPVSYRYQLNDGAVSTVQADGSGNASITIVPVRRANTLLVAAVGADGSVSGNTRDFFFTRAATPAADKDLNGDGSPDLVTVGGTTGLASGLWEANGDPNADIGRVDTPATNIGVNGFNISAPDPSDYDGVQVITGQYFGDGFQDTLAYRPNSGDAIIIGGSGDGSPLVIVSGNALEIASIVFMDSDGDSPLQLANAYNAAGTNTARADDLIGISGDAAQGFHLEYWSTAVSITSSIPFSIAAKTPEGGSDWNNWTLASAKLDSGTATFLWNRTTGRLYLWEAITVHDNGDSTGTITYTQYKIANHWNQGTALSTLEAADLNNDGTPDLWTVTPTGVARSYLISGLSATHPADIEAGERQPLR